MISSEDTTPLILFPSPFSQVRSFLSCLKGAVRLSPVTLYSSRFPLLAIKQMFRMSQNSPACLLQGSIMVIYLPPGDDLLQVWRGGKVVELPET